MIFDARGKPMRRAIGFVRRMETVERTRPVLATYLGFVHDEQEPDVYELPSWDLPGRAMKETTINGK